MSVALTQVKGRRMGVGACRSGHDPKRLKVGDIMNEHAAHCHERDDCRDALSVMVQQQLDCLPVVDENMLIVGVVTREELEAKSTTEI